MRSSKIFLLVTFYSQIFVLNTLLNPISTFFILPKIKSQAKDVNLSWFKSFEFITTEHLKIFLWTNHSTFGPSDQQKLFRFFSFWLIFTRNFSLQNKRLEFQTWKFFVLRLWEEDQEFGYSIQKCPYDVYKYIFTFLSFWEILEFCGSIRESLESNISPKMMTGALLANPRGFVDASISKFTFFAA